MIMQLLYDNFISELKKNFIMVAHNVYIYIYIYNMSHCEYQKLCMFLIAGYHKYSKTKTNW